jgi:hypothetical protein
VFLKGRVKVVVKRIVCLLTAAALMLGMGGALAEQKVGLPESRYSLTMPDEMQYDGPAEGTVPGDDARFAYVSKDLGLDVHFFCYDRPAGTELKALAEQLRKNYEDVAIYVISGIEMIVYRVADPESPPEKGMKCVGYVIPEEGKFQEIVFWYANQAAADRSAEIIATITDKD